VCESLSTCVCCLLENKDCFFLGQLNFFGEDSRRSSFRNRNCIGVVSMDTPHIHRVTRGTGTPKDRDEVKRREVCLRRVSM
jgi:hypothetical protein